MKTSKKKADKEMLTKRMDDMIELSRVLYRRNMFIIRETDDRITIYNNDTEDEYILCIPLYDRTIGTVIPRIEKMIKMDKKK